MKSPSRPACRKAFRAWLILASFLLSFAATPSAAQTFSSGSTGEDGPFNPTCAPPPCTVTVGLPESGVFNFTTINVPTGVTVRFTRSSTNTPATLLATGDVTLAGIIDVSGGNAAVSGLPGRGGPGGFDGGMGGNVTVSLDGTSGLGPGGGGGGDGSLPGGSGGGFGTTGTGSRAGTPYGIPTLLPLIGGAGGGGGLGSPTLAGGGGGGGGGALLIASSGTIHLTIFGGQLRAGGGSEGLGHASGGGGSGGAMRLVANRILGNNSTVIIARGGGGPFARGGLGRIRLEAFELSLPAAFIDPPPSAGTPGPVMPPTGFPSLQIIAVGGLSAPPGPKGNFLAPPDIVLSPIVPSPVTVELQASNIPPGTTLMVTVIPEAGSRTTVDSTPLAGTLESSTATASVTLTNGVSVINANATFAAPRVGLLGNPMVVAGDAVKWIRVTATNGGPSRVSYITVSGREVEFP